MNLNQSMSSLLILVATATLLPPAAQGLPLEERFRTLDKGSPWTPGAKSEIRFRTYHPQGLTGVGDCLFLSSVEVKDRQRGLGTAHLFKMDRQGTLLGHLTLGEGEMYHPGGIDYDGTSIWVSVGAYRSHSHSIVYTVDPETLKSREVFRFEDHLGAVSHCPDSNLLIAVNWGARRFYRWRTALEHGAWTVPDPTHPRMTPNGNHYIDYQDLQRIPDTPYLLCSGVHNYSLPGKMLPALRLGGIDLVHVEELRAHHQIPVPLRKPLSPAWTQNPFYVEATDTGLRFIFIPEDNTSTLHTFEVKAER